jgi:hypothetical protein
VDPANNDFRLKEGSPASRIGFKPFDFTKAGVYGDAAWAAIPKSFTFAEVRFAPDPPPPPPMTVDLDFEQSRLGAPPADARTLLTENKGDSIGVSDDFGAAGSKQSLKIEDAPGLEYSYNPHFAFHPEHKAGTSTSSFDLRLTPGVVMYHEWRSWDVNPYKVGPSFWIRDNNLEVAEKQVLALPVGEWIHIEVTAKVGEDADGKWQLAVTLPNAEPQKFELTTGSPEFKTFSWAGFSSSANEKTAFYLDNIKLTTTAP